MTIPTDVRHDCWLMFSRAFLTPMDNALASAVRETLADDLDDLYAELELPAREDLDLLRRSLAKLPDNAALLLHYSRLFLAPPVPARLNLCHYLDGNPNGASRDALDLLFAHHSIEKAETFKDQPDHLSAILELMALLATTNHEEETWLAEGFLRPALQHLAASIAEVESDSPYLVLCRLLQMSCDAVLGVAKESAETSPNKRHDTTIGVWRHCDGCGKPYAREKEIQIMAKALAQQGLPSTHLNTCPDCRALS